MMSQAGICPCFPVVAQPGRALKKQILSGILTAILSLGAQMLPVRIRPTGLWDSLTEERGGEKEEKKQGCSRPMDLRNS